jgi:hypothetical protein
MGMGRTSQKKGSRDIEVGKEKATVTEEGLVASSQKAGSIGSLIYIKTAEVRGTFPELIQIKVSKAAGS